MKIEGNAQRILRLYARQEGRCPYTDLPLMPFIEQGLVSEDHVVPKAKGGKDEIDNKALVPEWVNQMKKDMSSEEFRSFLTGHGLPTKRA